VVLEYSGDSPYEKITIKTVHREVLNSLP
jgi:hypothetical protein